ncbi:hypothetical protein MTO96_024154 [Rhipicephalus appendiculatus]
MGGGDDSSTQSPDIVSDKQEGTEAVTSESATTESSTTPSAETSSAETSTGETSTSGYSELLTRDGVTTMTPAVTEHPTSEGSQETQASPSDSATTEIAQPVGREELATQGVQTAEQTTFATPEESIAHTTEQVTTMSEQPETTTLPTYEATTTSSPAISSEGDGNAATTPSAVYRPDESTTPPAETATTMEAESAAPDAETTTPTGDITTMSTAEITTTFETTTPTPAAETTAAPAGETTAPSATEATEAPAAQTTETPVAETGEPSATETTETPVDETREPSATETTETSGAETTEPPAAETTEPPTAEATVQPAAETTTPTPEIGTQAADTTTRTVETTTAAQAEPETTSAVGDVTMPSLGADVTTGARRKRQAFLRQAAVRSNFLRARPRLFRSGARSLLMNTTISTASRLPPDLFSTTQSYTNWEASTTHAPSSVEPVGRENTEREPWNTYPTTVSTIQDWKPSTETPFYTPGSPSSTTTEGDESCLIMDGSLPVRCLLPEELNHTVTVKFGDLNRTREETFRTEARVWLLDYCNKNGIPIGEPTVVFLSGDRHMDHISFFVVNNTRGSVVPSDTVVAVLNSMKLTFEDKLGTAITDVFYGLPVLHKKDEPSTTFLGSSLGLVYVIVGAAVAALLLLALLVVIMVKCRTLSSNQYSPDSEKLTKDLQMRAEMGDLRPADEILKEEAQLKESINGNGTHINGDGWVVPYSQIVNERKDKPDAQDTRL